MGYRGKFVTDHTGIKLPDSFVEKHSTDYHIENGYLNIHSKFEKKSHFEIIGDLREFMKGKEFNLWAVIIWEDGRLTRFNLKSGDEEDFPSNDGY